AVEQVDRGRVVAAALELDADVTPHGRRRDVEVLDRQTRPGECSRCCGLTRQTDEAGQGERGDRSHPEPTGPLSTNLLNELHLCIPANLCLRRGGRITFVSQFIAGNG